MSDTGLEEIRRRFSEAYRRRDFVESAHVAEQGAALAERLGDTKTLTRMLVWQGESLWQRSETESATSVLMRAASSVSPADPLDVFSAISTLLSIALLERPLKEIQRLLRQGQTQLERAGRAQANHMLELTAGDLAGRRGDWTDALAHYLGALERQRVDAGAPRYTAASYLIKVAEAHFMLGNADALVQCCKTLNETPKEVEGDRLRAEQARLLCYRAGIDEPAGARGGAAATARRLLRWLEEIDGYRADYARDALLVLLLKGDWLSVETWLEYPGIGDVPLIRGDLYLARAREELGQPPQDPDWPSAPQQERSGQLAATRRAKAPDDLAAARSHYLAQQPWATREDARLQTNAHSHRLRARLERVDALARELA
jgi:hypothetical protein